MRNVRQVALILDTNRQYQRKIIRGVLAYAREANWRLYVEEDPLDKLPDLRTWRGHGVIMTFTDRKYVAAVSGVRIPVVGVEGGQCWYEDRSGIPYLGTDNKAVACMAAEHLLAQGYCRLGYYGMPRNRNTAYSQQRATAFRQAARAAGVPCSLYVDRHLSARKWSDLQRGLSRWLRSLEKPVGIMAANDARARHVLEACRAITARVPEDVAVIGVDNDELLCEATDPPLSSVEQGAQNVGYHAAELLDRLMSGKKATQIATYIAPERVVCRRSTDYLAIEDPDVAAAVRFIREHVQEHVRVNDVLQASVMSRSTLRRLFKKTMHKTVHEEVQQAMLARAQQLIIAGELTLKEVAAAAGFSHIQHMTKLFRQRLGQTPHGFQLAVRCGLAAPRGRSAAAPP